MLQTPEIFTVSSFKVPTFSLQNLKAQSKLSTDDIHAYHAGENIAFSIYIKGPPNSQPQDIKSYTISAYAKQKPDASRLNPNDTLKPIEVKVRDIISSTNVINLLKNAPLLNVSVIRQNEKGRFNAATGSLFNIKLPDSRYFGNTSGKVQLLGLSSSTEFAPENACSENGDKICGSGTLNISNCVTYKCWRFTKGSKVAKDCCYGLVKYSPDKDEQKSSSSSSSGQVIPTPACNKGTKEIECKSTNIYYVPYCEKRYIPDCSNESNSSGSSSSGASVSASSSSSGTGSLKTICKPYIEASSSSSSGNNSSSNITPICVPLDKATELYCNEIANLPYDARFSTSDYIDDFCKFISDPEIKKACCAGVGAIYDKVTKIENVTGEEDGIKSCVDYNANGGYCEDFKRAETCVREGCYKEDYGSDALKVCCLKDDKEASEALKLLENAQLSEDTGMVYNIVTFKGKSAQTEVKIQKSIDDLLAQNFELSLPNDPNIDSVIIKAACEDKNGKTYSTELSIALIPGEDTTIAKSDDSMGTCVQPAISSLKVADGGVITVSKDAFIEIPLIVTDADLDLSAVKITGLNSDFKSESKNKSPGYNFLSITGTPKSSGKLTVTATAEDACKPTKFTFDILVSDLPPPEPESNIVSVWLPRVPFVESEVLKSLIKKEGMSYTKITYDLPRAVIAGSKVSLELPLEKGLTNIDPSKLKVTWVSSTNRVKIPPSSLRLLPKGKLKLITLVDKNEPEGIAKVIISDIADIKNSLVEATVNVTKSQEVSRPNSMAKPFDKPIIEAYKIMSNPGKPDDPYSIKLKITGQNFIGRRAKINSKKVIISRKTTYSSSRTFTFAEFRNSNITVNTVHTEDKHKTLLIKLQLPKNYAGGKEELFISTPTGQTFTEIDFPAPGYEKRIKKDD